MSISWLVPAAFAGLVLIALPIAVHALVRQHARQLRYPSLRFLRETQLAAFRRRRIQDAALLACRIGIVVAAVVALAGPILRTPARAASYANRTSRAIVVAGGVERETVEQAAAGAFASTVIATATMTDALMHAHRWLDEQPPSAREIVILGALPRGAVTATDLSIVDREIGIRFVPADADAPSTAVVPILTRRNGTLVTVDRRIELSADVTKVSEGPAVPAPPELVRIIATTTDAPLAEAALRAALDAGVPWVNLNQRVVIVWEGADESGLSSNVRALRMAVPSPPSAAADAIREVLRTVSRPRMREPVLISAEQLAAWTRPPGRPSPTAPLSDDGDRRWMWALALLLLIIESWMRRPTATANTDVEEARIA